MKGACVAKGGGCGEGGCAWQERQSLQWTVHILLEYIFVCVMNYSQTQNNQVNIALKILFHCSGQICLRVGGGWVGPCTVRSKLNKFEHVRGWVPVQRGARARALHLYGSRV